MENTPQSLDLQRMIGDIKKKKEELDARRQTLTAERQRIELEWKLLDDDCRDIKERISNMIDSADSSDVAPVCLLGEGVSDGGKVFEEYVDPIDEVVAPIQALERQAAVIAPAPCKVVKYADAYQKKQIKTLLHSILELIDERGKIKLKDAAKEVDADENTLKQWVRIMEKRGMVHVSSSIRGEVFIEKMPYNASPQI